LSSYFQAIQGMRRQIRHLFLILAGMFLGLAFSVGSGVLAQKDLPSETLPWAEARLFAEVLERVRLEYVESVEDSQLIESAVRGMVKNLDPHSKFLNSEEYAEVQIATSGNYSGVGLEVNFEETQLRVVAAIQDTPAERAGIKSGDIIIGIDSLDVDPDNLDDAVRRLRGKPGTAVVVKISRDDEPDPIDFKLLRSNVQLNSVSYELLESGYGYIRISLFSDTTWRSTRKAVQQLRRVNEGPLKGMVLDLRDNPGGVLDAAVDVSDGFLDSGIIVKASGRAADANFMHVASDGDILEGVDLLVLVNGGSASSSEIVAGALKDNDRAIIAGTQTFGKGSVQTVVPLSDGQAIKITTSRYYTPSGVSIHGDGITPDFELTVDETKDLLAGISSVETDPGRALIQTDSQLREALRILKHEKIVQTEILSVAHH
jgi:carboxyl-terminal processing protease